MNKNAIHKYAIWARNELRNQITQSAFKYGITPKEKPERGLVSVNGIMLSPIERKQRDQLVDQVLLKGFDQVVEELAYTWFNRLIAIRFMEVNDYLPEHIRVLSSPNNEFKPEILTQALNLDEKRFKKDLILRLIDEGKQEELYRYLLLAECNALNEILPVMFEQMDGFTELMLPANLLKSDSVIGKLVSDIDEADWKVTGPEDEEGGQVQIIGWLYQYYNSELKDETFADLKKKNKKISKERIPAATQLFTPDWIVRYMVENSLGRLWLEGHPNDELKKNWKYYLEEAEQVPEVEAQLKEIRKEYAALKPEDLSVADLAMGSAHILVYAFDVLMKIYRSEGYRDRDAVKSILENNLYGLDIDDRAAQLAYFAIMMKAREYDRRIFSRGIQPNVFAIQESNGIGEDAVEYFANGNKELKADVKTLIAEMKDAKEYGSILKTSKLDYAHIARRLDDLRNDYNPYAVEARDRINSLIGPAKILSSTTWITCMNPPYMGYGSMRPDFSSLIKENYPDSKSDLYTVFMERASSATKLNGLFSMITQHSWMFISSYEKLRDKFLSKRLISMAHLGARAFDEIGGEVVQSTSFVVSNNFLRDYRTVFSRLLSGQSELEKRNLFLERNNNISIETSKFRLIPGYPYAYWMPPKALELFNGQLLQSQTNAVKGLDTCDNERFVRYWFEVPFSKIGRNQDLRKKWFFYAKGGGFRKWFGFTDIVVDWENDGEVLKNLRDDKGKLKSRPQNIRYYFQTGLTWSSITTYKLSLRFMENSIFGGGGSAMFPPNHQKYILGLLNSSTADFFLSLLNPTMNVCVNDILSIPFVLENENEVESLVNENIFLAKQDNDSQETSIDFKTTPLIAHEKSIKNAYERWSREADKRLNTLKENEEKLNRFFANAYSLNGVVPLKVSDKDILTASRKANLEKDIRALISYAVGTLFGRYAIEKDGVQETHACTENQGLIKPDPDNIIPVGEDEYFEDDLTARFIDWVRKIYGEETLEENLQYIADALGGKGSSREVIRRYFLNDFFTDHCKMYKKRPIYWLFDSGKKNGFKCLIYIHRYQPDTIARIRTDYVHEQQERYRSQIKHINDTIDNVPKSEQVKMRKQLKDLTGKLDEVTKYEEKIHHLADQMIKIDLDDGVKHNYAIFQDVLAKIK